MNIIETVKLIIKKLINNIDKYKIKVWKSTSCINYKKWKPISDINYIIMFIYNNHTYQLEIKDNNINLNIDGSITVTIEVSNEKDKYELYTLAEQLVEDSKNYTIRLMQEFAESDNEIDDI